MSGTAASANGRRAIIAGSARRAQLLDIATEMFATNGYAQTTVRDIADAAGILSGSLYHHFSSKEAMVTEMLQGFLDGLNQRFVDIVDEGDDPREIFDGLVRESFATIHDDPHTVALYQNEQGFLSTIAGFEFVAQRSRDIERVWMGVMEAGQKSGVFREDIDTKLSYRFIRDGIWSAVRWYRPGSRSGHKALAEQFLELIHGGLLTR